MTKGKVEYAERKAMELFDKWNDVTGVIEVNSSYYYEIQACIEDAVHCGIQAALYDQIQFNKDGEIIKNYSLNIIHANRCTDNLKR